MKQDRVVDLTVFREANENGKNAKKLSWDKRVELIRQQFPLALSLDWKAAFDRDPDLFAWILQDILKADCATPGRSGPKPNVDYRKAAGRLRLLMGEDYSTLPFTEAFTVLAGGRSLTSLARKTGLSRSQVHRLLRGGSIPDSYEMEEIAKAFGKPAGYFREYRLGLVVAALTERLEDHPEATVKYWKELAIAEAA